jgi:nucleoside-diphosphate-sugar epimerase
MKILITGAAGGIGSTLGYELYKLGHKLILVDNLRNGDKENLIINGESFGDFHEIDINSEDLHNLIKNEIPDIIIHLAAITSLPDCEVNYRECIRVNVEGTASVLGAASKYGVRRVIFGSTSAVYENTYLRSTGFKESDDINPRLFYSLSKKMSEEICLTYRENYGLDVLILRFFNVFGPRQDIHRKSPPIINYIVREMMSGNPPILHSNGEQSRDYIYINDVVNFIEKCLTIETNEFIFNLSTQTLTSVKDILESVKKSNSDFQSINEIYRESNKLWDSYPDLFSGKYPLKKEIIEKETNKKSLGDNSLSKKHLEFSPSDDIMNLIISTSIDIQNNKNKE